jgi:hypothetical protein
MRTPTVERSHPAFPSGTQRIYRFENGYGASVVRFSEHHGAGILASSYGGDKGLWELAVLRFAGDEIDRFRLIYDTPITDDVLGYLSEEEVDANLAKIEALP